MKDKYHPTSHDPSTSDLIAEQKEKEEKEMEEKQVVVAPIVVPAVSSQEAIEAWKKYEDLKSKIVTDSDVQKIAGKDFLKKSYWRKIATFFNLSLECVEEIRHKDVDCLTYCVTYKAIASNGRFSYGDGACSSEEKGLTKTEHNTRSIAHTRAYNRAVSNLVGGGEVSAEEMPPDALNGKPGALKDKSKDSPKPQGDLSEVLQFGKYKNKSFEETHAVNSSYFQWLLEKSDMFKNGKNKELRDKIELFLDAKRFEDEELGNAQEEDNPDY